MPKHTPGPWSAAGDCGDSGYQAVYDQRGRKLALVFHRDDAPLMAAAPTMRDALERVVAAHDEKTYDVGDYADNIFEAMKVVRAALAKVKPDLK